MRMAAKLGADSLTEPMNSSRYTTPEIGMGGYGAPPTGTMAPPDYAYVAYHDSGMPGGVGLHHRGSLGRQDVDLGAAPARSILKNRQVDKTS